MPLIRVWAVTAVTPVEQGLEVRAPLHLGLRGRLFRSAGRAQRKTKSCSSENGQLKIENQYLKVRAGDTADRAKALSVFQAQSPSKTVAARVIGNGTGANSKVVFVDRGSTSGVESGMAVVTPDGIVGKVVDAYPTASLVMLITDPTFAAGVVSQKNRVHGTSRGKATPSAWWTTCRTRNRWTWANGFTLPATTASFPAAFRSARSPRCATARRSRKSMYRRAAMQGGVEEVLIVLQGVHQEIPGRRGRQPGYKILAPPPSAITQAPQAAVQPAALDHRRRPAARDLQGRRVTRSIMSTARACPDPSRRTSRRFPV